MRVCSVPLPVREAEEGPTRARQLVGHGWQLGKLEGTARRWCATVRPSCIVIERNTTCTSSESALCLTSDRGPPLSHVWIIVEGIQGVLLGRGETADTLQIYSDYIGSRMWSPSLPGGRLVGPDQSSEYNETKPPPQAGTDRLGGGGCAACC